MMRTRATALNGIDHEALRQAIFRALDPNGAPIRLAEVVAGAEDEAPAIKTKMNATAWSFYEAVSAELQRMKRANEVRLIKGRGGGWVQVKVAL